jgi:subtilisin family serine protease
MRCRDVLALALAIAACLPARAGALNADFAFAEEPESAQPADTGATGLLPALGAGIPAAALIAAGAAAALAAVAGRSSGGEENAGAGGDPRNGSRTLSFTSAADFRTSEYAAQQGLQAVKADRLYYNGHYRWYVGDAPEAAAGTGIGVKIAVADTGINAREGSTGGAIAIDVARSYDFVNARAGAGADEFGHGTHVAGIIAAPKNGAGMHGLAYNAVIVNFKVGGSNGFITASDAQLGDMLYRSAAAGAMIINNSWASPSPITAFSREDLQASMPRMIEASRAYVAGGGVVVFAAGNDGASQPAMQAGMPYRITGLQPGWLAVVAIDPSGRIASYSNRCGVAAAWCLAAPGGAADTGLYSMYNDGTYASMYGTSMAAPHASAALGALKSMFPNLSYLQIRDRLLFTANKGGAYADASAYGQGVMDLEAASSPVGGVAVPTGASAEGATAPLAGSGIEFRAGALRALSMQDRVLVVDNYQRAPFWVPAQTLFREATPRLIERQWASLRLRPGSPDKNGFLRFSHSPGLNNAVSADLVTSRFGLATGAGGEAVLGSHLGLAWVPRLAAPEVDSVALGYASDLGGIRFGLLGTLPTTRATEERTLESSAFGSRRALGLIAHHRAAATTYGVALAAADGFERPIGIATSGAFEIDDSAAFSSGAFVQHAVSEKTILNASLEAARHRPHASAMLTTPDYAVRSASFGVRGVLGPKTTLSGNLRREWSGGEAARLDVPLTISENGAVGRATYTLPYADLVGRTAFTLRFDHQLARQADLRVGFTRERDGFGTSATGIAALVEIVN